MKTALKVLAALAAVLGAVYVIATYGEKIVAWAKDILSSCPFCKCSCHCAVTEEEAPVEEFAAEEAVEEEIFEEVAPVEIIIEENEPVADEADFEG